MIEHQSSIFLILQQNLQVRSTMHIHFEISQLLKETVWIQWKAQNACASTTWDISRSILFYLLSRATSCSHDASLSNEDDARGKTRTNLYVFIFFFSENLDGLTTHETNPMVCMFVYGAGMKSCSWCDRFGELYRSADGHSSDSAKHPCRPSKLIEADGKHDLVFFSMKQILADSRP